MRVLLLGVSVLSLSFGVLACGGSSGAPASPSGDTDASPTPAGDDASALDAGPTPEVDGSPAPDSGVTPPASDAGLSFPPDPGDGPPTRQTCTSTFGSALSTAHGRLDGYLVSIVQPGTHGCNGDSSHVHLQVKMNGAIYDVATNIDTYWAERDMTVPGGAWTEGWHAGVALDYPTLGIHSSVFTTPSSQSALAALITSALANANHVSIFATGYGPDGIHDVHRRSNGNDGAIVIDPLSATPHVVMFRFNTDSF